MRLGSRVVILAFAVSAFIFLIVPLVVTWWGTHNECPYQVTSRGVSDGTKWEVIRSDCGPTPTGTAKEPASRIVWQLRVIPDKGYSAVVMTAAGGPEPLRWEQSGFTGQVVVAGMGGAPETRYPIQLDPKGQPKDAVEFVDGTRQR